MNTPTFTCSATPDGRVQSQTNIEDARMLLVMVGAALQAQGQRMLEPPKPRLAIARELPQNGTQEVS